ncbi:hypothetical protein ACWKW1_09075 [Brevibacillus parabrevis]
MEMPEKVTKPVEASPKILPEAECTIESIAGKTEVRITELLDNPAAIENGEWTSLSTEEKTLFVRYSYKTSVGAFEVMFIERFEARIEVRLSKVFRYLSEAINAMRSAGLRVRTD